MLLLPTTLATLSVAFSAALVPAPAQDEVAGQTAHGTVAEAGHDAQAHARAIPRADCLLATDCGPVAQSPGMVPQGQSPELLADTDIAGPGPAPEEQSPDVLADADIAGFGLAVDAASLDDMRGGDGNSGNAIVMNGTVADNRATNVVTGTNMITEGAFANASGVPMVVQNTGANVLIQNATVINLQLR